MKLDRWLESFPPYLIRALARDRKRKRAPLTRAQIAKAAGESERWVDKVSDNADWGPVTVGDLKKFLAATGFNLARCNRERAYLIRTFKAQENSATHINSLPPAEKEFIFGLLAKYQQEIIEILKRESGVAVQ